MLMAKYLASGNLLRCQNMPVRVDHNVRKEQVARYGPDEPTDVENRTKIRVTRASQIEVFLDIKDSGVRQGRLVDLS